MASKILAPLLIAGPAMAQDAGADDKKATDLDNVTVTGIRGSVQKAQDIKREGFKIITWTFERSDLRKGAPAAGFYYAFDPQGRAVKKDADMYKALDALARKVGVVGVFSDWPATVSYYASCMGLD